VTIDGRPRDFDDAVWVEQLSSDFALHVHCRQATCSLTPIDQEAQQRSTSVYFPDRAVPVLPLVSTEICSLNPKVDRLVMSALLEIDHGGDVVGQEFTRGIIRSAERMTYTDVHALLEGDAALRERYALLVDRFEMMRKLAEILTRRRYRRGSIDFDLPEPLIEFDEFGEMTGIARSPRNIAHRIIEEFMLAANEAVAGHIAQSGSLMVYRIHDNRIRRRCWSWRGGGHFGVAGGRACSWATLLMTTRHRTGAKQGKRWWWRMRR
jgi:ribonuclease R